MRRNGPFGLLVLLLLVLTGCGGGGETDSTVAGADATPPAGDTEPSTPPQTPTDRATFRLTFVGTWTGAGHPADLPPGAHFSPPVGVVHRRPDILWRRDGTAIASAGIEQMAESGGTSVVRGEIAGHVAFGTALTEVVANGLGATGSTSTTFEANDIHSFLSLTSMIAPSPDWFVGVRNVELRPEGTWIDRVEIDLSAVYDAGTDSGPTFVSPNADVTPHHPIHLVSDDGVHFQGPLRPLAVLVIERLP